MAKKNSKYRKIILIVAKKFYKAKNHKPRITDYCIEVAKIMTANPVMYEKRTASQVRRQLTNVLKELSSGTNNELLCLENKYYVLNKTSYFCEKIAEEYYASLVGKINVKRKDIIRISFNTCALIAESSQDCNDNNITLKSIFQKCLGENCFALIEHENLLYIMLKCNPNDNGFPTPDSKECFIIDAIEKVIKRIFDEQSKKGLVPLKRKRKMASKKQNINQNNLQ